MTDNRSRRERILAVVDDLVSNFLYYGRKECEFLPHGEIESAVNCGEITMQEIVDRFAHGLGE